MKVLIADDSPPIQDLLHDMLAEIEGLEFVGKTDDALAVVEQVRRDRPDVVLLDIRLRRGSGLGALRTIKKEKSAPVVIVLSALSSPDYREACAKLGADWFFDKTTQLGQMVEAVQGVARRFVAGSSSK